MEPSQRSVVVLSLWGLEILMVLLHVVDASGPWGDATYLVGVFTAAALAWYGTATAPPHRRLVPMLIATGLTSSALGASATSIT